MWQTVTVASPPGPFCSNSRAIGLPTICDRPSTTACAAPGLDLRVEQQFTDPQRRARHEPRRTDREEADVERVKAVDVLQGIDPLDDGRLVDLLGQRQLHQDAVDRRIVVQSVDRGEQFGLGSRREAAERVPFIPAALQAASLVADVDLAGRIVADQHDGQARDDPSFGSQLGDLGAYLAADLLRECTSIENLSRQENAPGNLVGLSPTEGEKIYRRLLY